MGTVTRMAPAVLACLILGLGADPPAKDAPKTAPARPAGPFINDRGGPARTGAFPEARGPEKPQTLWIDDLDKGAGQPIVAGDRLIVGCESGELLLLKPDDGAVLQRFRIPAHATWPPAADGERVYIAGDNQMVAISLEGPEQAWTIGFQGRDAPAWPLLIDGMVIFGSADGLVRAVDARTGRERWKVDIVADAPADPPGFDGKRARIEGSRARPQGAASDGTNVYVPIFDQSRVVALDLKTGEKRWSFQTGGWVSGAPTVAEGKVFLGSQDHNVYAIDAKTGERRWAFATQWRADGEVAYHDGAVYVAASDGRCYSVNAKDGSKNWEYETEVGPDKKHYFLSGSPLVDATAVYFGSWDGHLYALNRKDGTLKWRHKPWENGEHVGAPVTDGKRIFVPLTPQFDFDAQRDKPGVHGIVAVGE